MITAASYPGEIEPKRKPWRIESISCRLSDEYSDILEAEYLYDDRVSRRYHLDNHRDPYEVRRCYDESQALEVLSVEPGWMYGEKFYRPSPPGFDDEECYVQDFGFGPYKNVFTDHFSWRSIIEEPVEQSTNLSDLLSPEFFLPVHKKSLPRTEEINVQGT